MTSPTTVVTANENIKGYVLHEGPAYSLALNNDHTHVVVAGRNVLKVFIIEQGGFKEWVNLRCGKTSNVQNSSSMDVDWNPSDDNILATATTGGAVVTWNLNRASRNKQEHVFYDHKRTVNKVTFHTGEPNLLMSGSQDGTIKCFDLRLKEPAKTYTSDSESIRDVQFSPHNNFVFAAASENGTIQIWDSRKADKCQSKYSAHNGPVFSCDWHSELQLLATASRDKTIKVWNVTTNKPIAEYTISTTAPVGRIKWRPYRKYHLASSALVLDSAINVWDVRRPYIPYASFTKHTDVATCIAWKGDPFVLLSTNRDSTLHQNFMSEADLPLERSNQHGMVFMKNGDLMHCTAANLENLKSENNKSKENSRKTSTTISSEEDLNTSSILRSFQNLREVIDDPSHCIEMCALEYKLQGKSIGELCEHNASVAASAGRHTVYLLWNILRILYDHRMSLVVLNNTIMCSSKIESGGDDSNDSSDEDGKKDLIYRIGDFHFGDAEIDPLSADLDQYDLIGLPMDSKTVQEVIAWSVPTGTINLRHKIKNQPIIDNPYVPKLALRKMNNCLTSAPILQITSPAKFDGWNPSEIVVNALRHHADMGDIQTVVSVLCILNDETRSEFTNPNRPWHLTLREIEIWWASYIELLNKFKLWTCSTTVIQCSRLNSILQLHRTSTSVYLSCGLCFKGLNRNSRHCYSCRQSECARCALCQRIVKGMFAWCRGCAHGGHINHMKQWFMENKYCPTGCGHKCEYQNIQVPNM
ncbi:WD40/YVTN repeat-like-containing domain,WD40-repeat-containing domain,WD40 repeat,WD40 repeat [Cinara cedri]|uniref:GATOR2 complex protein WDR24 n=1 Tax=Cinara cedri TaxID=506608 RepID=A0A5E4NNW9_9HEMI|nr:WD40/YVTN repeat-like-containing domain,WD40-repeat-containing domain,WD40 repeat,WD40 repeat [Cinara cedri]